MSPVRAGVAGATAAALRHDTPIVTLARCICCPCALQLPNAGIGLDLPLLEWLERYTFPLEARFADLAYARKTYDAAVRRTLRHGTTTCAYYASIHKDSSVALAECCARLGQRAFVGKVSMDRNAPAFYCEDTQSAVRDAEEFVRTVQDRHYPLVQPIVTPRFAPACSEQLLRGLGRIANTYSAAIQSHLAETRPECRWVSSLFPSCSSYTAVYDAFGLLRTPCIMAHGIHLDDNELALLHDRGTGIAHCPCSNFKCGRVLHARTYGRTALTIGAQPVQRRLRCAALAAGRHPRWPRLRH